MPLPHAPEARDFYRSAKQRWLDAQYLEEGNRTTGAVYLAGYAVECILKALILASIARAADRKTTLDSFRGSRAHDFGWLRNVYLRTGGAAFPAEVTTWFWRVNSWSTDLRYHPGTVVEREAVAMFEAARGIMTWAEGRL